MVKFILGAIVLVFVFWGIGSFRSGRMDVAARVNGHKILMEDLQRAYARTMEGYRRMFGGSLPSFIKVEDVKKQVLNDLINRSLVMQAASEMGIVASDEEVRQAILHIPAFRTKGAFDQRLYERALREARLTPPVFEAQVRQELVTDKIKALLSAGLDVTGRELLDRYMYENQEISLDYVVIDPASCTKDVKVTDQDLNAWYESHKESYRTKPLEKIRYLLFKKADLVEKADVSQEEVESYYQEHEGEFLVKEQRKASHILIRVPRDAPKKAVEEARKRAEDLYERAKRGESFAALARKYSQDPGSAKAGGSLGFFTRGTMVKPFDDKVFSMKEGEVSPPVRTRFGWHVIRLDKIRPRRQRPLKEVKSSIEARLRSRKATQLLWDEANKAYDEIIEAGGLLAYAKHHGFTLETTDYFSRSRPPKVLGHDGELLSSLFAMSKGELSSLLEVPQGVMVAEVVDKKAPYVPKLKDVLEKVRGDYTREKARELCRKKAQGLLKEAAGGKGLAEAAKAMGLEVKETGYFKRTDMNAGGKLPPEAARVARTLYGASPCPKDVVEAAGAFYVLAFKQARDADPSGLDKVREELKKRLLESKKRTVFQDWLNHQRERARIEISKGI